jgi:hypothetical protein
MLRGIEGRPIFGDDRDRENLLLRLDRILTLCTTCCYAWALMTNHLHLLLQTGAVGISKVMAQLNTGYAMYFNRRYGRRGYFFQDRFKSRRVTSDGDLMNLIRYIHRNPLEAGLVSDLDALEPYRWCGHSALVGTRLPRLFHAADSARALFGPDAASAIEALRTFMASESSVNAASLRLDDRHAPGDRYDGSAEHAEGSMQERFAALASEIAAALDLSVEDLRGASKRAQRVKARAELCFRAVHEIGMTRRDIARMLGISCSAAGRAANAGFERRRISPSDDAPQARGGAGEPQENELGRS